jgi:hypothetical protein
MKDVAACEKLRGAGKRALIRRCPNGETHPSIDGFQVRSLREYSERKSFLRLKRVKTRARSLREYSERKSFLRLKRVKTRVRSLREYSERKSLLA